MNITKVDIAIVGAGPIGIFSAFQAGMLGMNTCVIDALSRPGGQCTALYPMKPIYDIPGYSKIIAQELIDQLLLQAKKFDPRYLLSQIVISILYSDDLKSFVLLTSDGSRIECKAVLIATGAGIFCPNVPPIKNISIYHKKSVFYFISDMVFEKIRGKKVVIAGGGDSAIDWLIFLSSFCDVSIVHRRLEFKAMRSNVKEMYSLFNENKIKMYLGYQISELIGLNGTLKKVVIQNFDFERTSIMTDFLLPFFGLAKSSFILHVDNLKRHGYLICSNIPSYETTIPGIYAVGDVAHYNGKIKLISVGFAEAALALYSAYSRVFDNKNLKFEYSSFKFLAKT